MKKWNAILLVLALLLSLAACGEKKEEQAELPQNTVAESVSVTESKADTSEETVEVQQQAGTGYWEVVYINSADPSLAVTEEEVSAVRESGVRMYLDLLEDGTGTFCFDGETPLMWQEGSITVEGDETFSFTVENDQLILDLTEMIIEYRKAARPYPVVSEMQQAGFTEFMEEWVAYPYTTICSEDETAVTTGEATVIAYEIFESEEGYPGREGYEWRVASIEVRFFDENAQKYGAYPFYRHENYYNVKLYDQSIEELNESEEYYAQTALCTYYEQEVEIYLRIRDSWSSWRKDSSGNDECYYNIEFAFQVPIGYDGAVVGLEDGSYEYPEDSYITDCDPSYSLLFRLN
ncbi:MAG: hypothetical protein IKT52_09300 [Oscillospiraceae bacterium]|nr:hypothetical protein [Oscillospiraceae bacterium]